MKILFISNFYPPARPGGYTQWCQEVAEGLEGLGHTVAILTSSYESWKADHVEPNVYRLLHLTCDPLQYSVADFFTGYRREQAQNESHLRAVLKDVAPDLVFIWGMWLMSKRIPAMVEDLMEDRVVYYISDYWPAQPSPHAVYWNRPANRMLLRLPRLLLSRLATIVLGGQEQSPELKFEHAICVSQAVKTLLMERGVPVGDAEVIYGGSDLGRFADGDVHSQRNGGTSLLYAGQLVPHKGVDTAIEAMARLVHGKGFGDITLTLVGSGSPAYEARLQAMVKARRLQENIAFRGGIDKADMPSVFASHDILVFPSTYEEPFARVTQEAMASGMAVVGTTTGGTGELLREGKTGLTFPAGDAHRLAMQIERLIQDPDLRWSLAQSGREAVTGFFTLERMIDEIETYLEAIRPE